MGFKGNCCLESILTSLVASALIYRRLWLATLRPECEHTWVNTKLVKMTASCVMSLCIPFASLPAFSSLGPWASTHWESGLVKGSNSCHRFRGPRTRLCRMKTTVVVVIHKRVTWLFWRLCVK